MASQQLYRAFLKGTHIKLNEGTHKAMHFYQSLLKHDICQNNGLSMFLFMQSIYLYYIMQSWVL